MRLQHARVHRPVDPQHHDRVRAVQFWLICAASMLTAASPSSAPTRAHHAGPVRVRHHQHVALGAQVEVPAVDLDQLRHLVSPDSVPDTVPLAVGHRGPQRAPTRGSRRSPARWSGQRQPALGGQRRRVDEGDRSSTTPPNMPAHRGQLQDRGVLRRPARRAPRPPPSWARRRPARCSMVPSFWVSGIQGRTSSPTPAAACTFTASGTNSPRSASCTDRATSVPALSCASSVDAPRCGVTTTLRQLDSGLWSWRLVDVDVDARRRRPVPARTASASACSSIRPPRAALTISTPGLVSASWSLADQPQGLRRACGRWIEMMSAGAAGRRRSTSRTPSGAARAGCDVRVVGDERGAERGDPLRRTAGRSCRARPRRPSCRDLDAGERAALPLPGPQAASAAGMFRADGEQQGDRVLGGGDDVRLRGVDHQHAAGGGGRHVDVVQPDAGPRDDLELGGGGQRLGVDLVADRTSIASASASAAAARPGPRRRRAGSRLRRRARHRGRRELLGDQHDGRRVAVLTAIAALRNRGRRSPPMVVGTPTSRGSRPASRDRMVAPGAASGRHRDHEDDDVGPVGPAGLTGSRSGRGRSAATGARWTSTPRRRPSATPASSA